MSKHRRRILVALIPPPELTAQVRAVASLFGRTRFERIVPHVTVVPPMNLADADLPEALLVVRRAAAETEPFSIGFSSLASFAPSARTVHLAVDDVNGDLSQLRDRVRVGPLFRDDPRPFSPHLTLISRASDDQIAAALSVDAARQSGGGLLGPWDIDRLHVMEQHRDESGTRWEILSEEPLGGETVVGRGGIELHLRCVESIEPSVFRLLRNSGCVASKSREEEPVAPQVEGRSVCVVAELPDAPGDPVCVALGRVEGESARLDALVTAKEHRREGMAHHVLSNWCFQSAKRGAAVALAAGPDGFLEQAGFTRLGDLVIRQLQ